MRVMILGADGYLGRPTALHLKAHGHEVFGSDNYFKREMQEQCSCFPLVEMPFFFEYVRDMDIRSRVFNAGSKELHNAVDEFQPDAIVHYAEQPSAPFSMRDLASAKRTVTNNVSTTLNLLWAVRDKPIHIVKLGTMGEYGTPGIPIPEGWTTEVDGHKARLPFPKLPGSIYHASKVADSALIEFCCRAWDVAATDLNQGVVYGYRTDECEETSFHYDEIFGTCLNRFITQAVAGHPLTVYGKGGQTRGWLNIKDTMQCVRLAVENPAKAGEFRVFNQIAELFSINQLAELVARETGATVKHLRNPRAEEEEHFYEVDNAGLLNLGFEPIKLDSGIISEIYTYIEKHIGDIDQGLFEPRVKWRYRT